MKRFWEIVYDDDKRTMEIIGTSTDDTLLTNNVSKMIRSDMHVRCQVLDISIEKEDIDGPPGYTKEENLYSRLLLEYEKKTGKVLKQF